MTRTFAVANAMVCLSRNSPPSGLTKYFPLQRSDLDIMASSLSGLVPSGIQSLTEFFTGEFLAVMSLPVQLRIFSCFVHEGAKIIYRVAIAIIRRCRQDLLSSDSELATTDAFRRLCISQYCESKAFMKTIFAIHLSRSRIERFIRQAKDSRSRALVMAPSTNHVPLWPNIDQARKWFDPDCSDIYRRDSLGVNFVLGPTSSTYKRGYSFGPKYCPQGSGLVPRELHSQLRPMGILSACCDNRLCCKARVFSSYETVVESCLGSSSHEE